MRNLPRHLVQAWRSTIVAHQSVCLTQVHPFRVAMERECVFAEKLWFGGKSDATRTAKLLRNEPK